MNTNIYKTTHTIRKPETARITLLIATIFLGSCTANAGYRHNHYEPATSKSIEYHYFPNAHVYYDSHRRVYHYHHKQRGWLSVKNLPKYIHLDRHRRYPVRSDHQKPWKKHHLQKEQRSHFDRHIDKHNKKTPRSRHTYKAHSPQHSIKIDQARHNREKSHQDKNHPQMKHTADVHKQRKSSRQNALKEAQKNIRQSYKFTEKKSRNRHTTAVKKTGRKMQNTHQYQKNERRRGDAKQGKNRIASDSRPSREGDKHRRN